MVSEQAAERHKQKQGRGGRAFCLMRFSIRVLKSVVSWRTFLPQAEICNPCLQPNRVGADPIAIGSVRTGLKKRSPCELSDVISFNVL